MRKFFIILILLFCFSIVIGQVMDARDDCAQIIEHPMGGYRVINPCTVERQESPRQESSWLDLDFDIDECIDDCSNIKQSLDEFEFCKDNCLVLFYEFGGMEINEETINKIKEIQEQESEEENKIDSDSSIEEMQDYYSDRADGISLEKDHYTIEKLREKEELFKEKLAEKTEESSWKDDLIRALGESIIDPDSILGDLIRYVFEDLDLLKEDGLYTSDFFEFTDGISGNEMAKIEAIYHHVTDIISVDYDNNFRNSEEVLRDGKGVCRDQAVLLSSALKRHGIDAELINTQTHIWVRVADENGRIFDLDPTWYETFIPLEPRN